MRSEGIFGRWREGRQAQGVSSKQSRRNRKLKIETLEKRCLLSITSVTFDPKAWEEVEPDSIDAGSGNDVVRVWGDVDTDTCDGGTGTDTVYKGMYDIYGNFEWVY